MPLLDNVISAAFDGDQAKIDAFNDEIQAALDSSDPSTLDLSIRLTPQSGTRIDIAIDLERRIKAPSQVGTFDEESSIDWDGSSVSPNND